VVEDFSLTARTKQTRVKHLDHARLGSTRESWSRLKPTFPA
jgi:hypothetical protein